MRAVAGSAVALILAIGLSGCLPGGGSADDKMQNAVGDLPGVVSVESTKSRFTDDFIVSRNSGAAILLSHSASRDQIATVLRAANDVSGVDYVVSIDLPNGRQMTVVGQDGVPGAQVDAVAGFLADFQPPLADTRALLAVGGSGSVKLSLFTRTSAGAAALDASVVESQADLLSTFDYVNRIAETNFPGLGLDLQAPGVKVTVERLSPYLYSAVSVAAKHAEIARVDYSARGPLAFHVKGFDMEARGAAREAIDALGHDLGEVTFADWW